MEKNLDLLGKQCLRMEMDGGLRKAKGIDRSQTRPAGTSVDGGKTVRFTKRTILAGAENGARIGGKIEERPGGACGGNYPKIPMEKDEETFSNHEEKKRKTYEKFL